MHGDSVANVCSNFVVTGLKEDNNTKLLMQHVPKNQQQQRGNFTCEVSCSQLS
jgi:hypothetical protein